MPDTPYNVERPYSLAEDERTAAFLVSHERKRQVEVEGYSSDHDDRHGHVDICRAANQYRRAHNSDHPCEMGFWPWRPEEWKPRNRLSNLVRAGALYQAAADVADRKGILLLRDILLDQVKKTVDEIDAYLKENPLA